MSYSDTIRGPVANFNAVADLIDGQLISISTAGETGVVRSTTSSSMVTRDACSIALSVAAGEAVFLIATIGLSHSISAEDMDLAFFRDSGQLGYAWTSYAIASATHGNYISPTIWYVDPPSAGSYTYTLKWNRGASGTAYSAQASMYALKFRNT